MTEEDIKKLRQADQDGLLTYEYIANNVNNLDEDMPVLVEVLADIDRTGQFTASAARFLKAMDAERYARAIERLVAVTIDHDREHNYLPELMQCIYGSVSPQDAVELCSKDNNFRRMYKRLYADTAM